MRVRGMMAGVLALLCGALIIFGGCSKEEIKPKPPLSKHTGNYTTDARIKYKELSAVAKISQETPSSCSVEFESPPSLSGMAFVFKSDKVDLNYKGLSFTYSPESIPGGAIAKLATSAINRAMKDDGLSVVQEDGALRINGVMESGSFSLTLDKKTGNLMKLSVPEEELEIEFENFTFLD